MDTKASFRLPRNAFPRRYEVELSPDLAEARFDGRVTVTLDVAEPSDKLVLHAVDLEIHDAVLEVPGGPAQAATVAGDGSEQQVALSFPETLHPGAGYRLTIGFSGRLNDQLRGFYRSTFKDQTGAERVIATTQFESSDARRAFPCWDEPDFKATFQITLVVEPELTCVSNAPVELERVRADGRIEMRFAETMLMSTYLVAFVVGPYELTDPVQAAGVPVRIATVAGKLHLSQYAADVAVHALAFLGDYFGIPYPGAKLDHVAVPDFAFGAMENLGCVTYRESALLADPTTAAQTELQRVAAVIAHETAHMWFGDLVTMKWWNGIWLNEAFATFMELTTTDAFRPEWQVWTAFGAGKAAAMLTDGLRATRPVEYAVGRPEEAEGMFDVLTYQKGGSVLRMLEQYLGPEVFRKGITQYLSTHAYGNTETSDLWNALEAVSGAPVRTIMDSWIRQGGYPLVSADAGADPATVVLRQARFLYDGGDSPEVWALPIGLKASVEGVIQHERLLLDRPEGTFTFGGPVDWVVINDGDSGFYRSRYSPDLWERLSDAGPNQILTPLERLAVVADAWAAVVAGRAELTEWADVAGSVSADADPDVWAAVASVAGLLDLMADDSERAQLRQFVLRLARPVWDGLGWDPAPGEGGRTALARGRVLHLLAGVGEDPGLAAEAARRFDGYLVGGAGPAALAPDLVGPVARIVVATGTEASWSEVLRQYEQATNPQEQLRYLNALADTPYPDLRTRTLDMSLSGAVRTQDAAFVIGRVMSQRGAAEPAWRWVEDHWADAAARIPASLSIRILEAATAFSDPGVARSVHAFCAGRDLPFSEIRVRQVLERMDVNVALADRLRGQIGPALAP